MRLSELLRDIPGAVSLDPGDPEILGVECDTRSLGASHLFAAIRGVNTDGHDFLAAAAAAGAAACLVEEERPAPGLVRVRVPDTEVALGRAAAAFWGHPSRSLRLVGITGTNGKTTTAYLIQHLLREAGMVAGRLGTVSNEFPSGEEPAPLTTPDAPALQRALARMVREGAAAAVMEVSSHALHRKRVEACRFDCTVFTNLTQDHLDYHGTMEAYFEAKQLLFERYRGAAPAVINREDPWGRRLLEALPAATLSFGLQSGDVRVEVREAGGWGMRGTVHYPGGECPLEFPLAGEFNARNAAAALAAAAALGLDVPSAASALAGAPQVPGRIEAIANDRGLSVYVDYAHTPDALDRVLAAVAPLTRGRLIGVFGCGGDRDRSKRPHMARAAARWCDNLVLTADNSRSEATDAILAEIEIGMPVDWRLVEPKNLAEEPFTYVRLSDRAEAIRAALDVARPGDTVVIAGKGHETTQTLSGVATHFDDREEARRALVERGGRP